jgi:hypothetical protein
MLKATSLSCLMLGARDGMARVHLNSAKIHGISKIYVMRLLVPTLSSDEIS